MATNKTVFFLIGILLIVLGASMLAPYALQVTREEEVIAFFLRHLLQYLSEYCFY